MKWLLTNANKFLLLLLQLTYFITNAQDKRDTIIGWSEVSRNDFITSCTKSAAGALGEEKAKAYCTCMQQKIERRYPNSNDANKITADTMQKPEMIAMVRSCLNLDTTSRQNDSVRKNNNNNAFEVIGHDTVYRKVEVEAAFPGGPSAWANYLRTTLNPNTPVDHGAPDGTYIIYIQFRVGVDGKIKDATALTNYGYGMEREALRVIKASPPWIPAIQYGRKVNAWRKQPITFLVSSH